MDNVSVVIPALNEPNLQNLLMGLHSYDIKICREIGLANAVFHGIQIAKGKFVVIMDGDGSHPAEAISHMLNLLDQQTWLVIGSRYCKGAYSQDSTLRKIISLFYCKVAQIFLRTQIHDPMSGFWVGHRWAFNFKPSKTYKYGLQLIRKYKKHIKEYPIVFSKRQQGKSHVKPLQALKDFLSIFAFS